MNRPMERTVWAPRSVPRWEPKAFAELIGSIYLKAPLEVFGKLWEGVECGNFFFGVPVYCMFMVIYSATGNLEMVNRVYRSLEHGTKEYHTRAEMSNVYAAKCFSDVAVACHNLNLIDEMKKLCGVLRRTKSAKVSKALVDLLFTFRSRVNAEEDSQAAAAAEVAASTAVPLEQDVASLIRYLHARFVPKTMKFVRTSYSSKRQIERRHCLDPHIETQLWLQLHKLQQQQDKIIEDQLCYELYQQQQEHLVFEQQQQQHPVLQQQKHPVLQQQQHPVLRQQHHPVLRQQQKQQHPVSRQQQHPVLQQQQHPALPLQQQQQHPALPLLQQQQHPALHQQQQQQHPVLQQQQHPALHQQQQHPIFQQQQQHLQHQPRYKQQQQHQLQQRLVGSLQEQLKLDGT